MGQYDRKAQSQPKHGKPSSSGASKAAPPIPVNRPEWKGPSFTKKSPRPTQPSASFKASIPAQEQNLTLDVQQKILDIFRDAFPRCHDFEQIKLLLHDINDNVQQKNFSQAWSTRERQEAYALRWSPSRALAYANILRWITTQLGKDRGIRSIMESENSGALDFLCFGDTIAAYMGCAGFLHASSGYGVGETVVPMTAGVQEMQATTPSRLRLKFIDHVDWSSLLDVAESQINLLPELSKYASASAHANNMAFLPAHSMLWDCRVMNLHADGIADLLEGVSSVQPTVVCFFHTLADMFYASSSKSSLLLRRLSSYLSVDSLVIVVEKVDAQIELVLPGIKTHVCSLAGLLSQILGRGNDTDATIATGSPVWERLIDEAARDHRLVTGKLRYPASLENVKFQCRVYRRIS